MSAIPILLADAITAVLNAAVAASSFTSLTAADLQVLEIRRSYPDWDDDFKDLNGLAVDVVHVSSGSNGGDVVELNSETTLNTDTAFDIAVRYRFPPNDRESAGRLKSTAVDKYVNLVEEIHETLAGERMQELDVTGVSANWLDTSVRTYCDYGRLRQGNFMGVVRVRYKAVKAG